MKLSRYHFYTEWNQVVSFCICVTIPSCTEFLPMLAVIKNMSIILDKDFPTYYLPETRPLVYKMKTFSGTPTETVYIFLRLCA